MAKPACFYGATGQHWRKARIEIGFSQPIMFELDVEAYIFTENGMIRRFFGRKPACIEFILHKYQLWLCLGVI